MVWRGPVCYFLMAVLKEIESESLDQLGLRKQDTDACPYELAQKPDDPAWFPPRQPPIWAKFLHGRA